MAEGNLGRPTEILLHRQPGFTAVLDPLAAGADGQHSRQALEPIRLGLERCRALDPRGLCPFLVGHVPYHHRHTGGLPIGAGQEADAGFNLQTLSLFDERRLSPPEAVRAQLRHGGALALGRGPAPPQYLARGPGICALGAKVQEALRHTVPIREPAAGVEDDDRLFPPGRRRVLGLSHSDPPGCVTHALLPRKICAGPEHLPPRARSPTLKGQPVTVGGPSTAVCVPRPACPHNMAFPDATLSGRL